MGYIIYFFPIAVALGLTYPLGETLGEDLLLGLAGALLGNAMMWSIDVYRGGVRLHKGVVCLSGYHVSWLFMLSTWIPVVISTLLGVWIASALPSYWGIAPALMVYGVGSLLFMMLWKQSTPFWEDQWDNFVRGTMGGLHDDGEDNQILAYVNRHIDWLFLGKSGAQTVNEFEMLLRQSLVFRGYALGLGDESVQAVEVVVKDMVLKDPEKRRAWLHRDLNDDVWNEIAPAYNSLVHEVRAAQTRRLHSEHEES